MKLRENDHVNICHHRYTGSVEVIRLLISIQATINDKYLSVLCRGGVS